MKLSKGQREVLIRTMAVRGEPPMTFLLTTKKEEAIVAELAERGLFEKVKYGSGTAWRQTRNGHLAALEAAKMPEPGKWHGRKP